MLHYARDIYPRVRAELPGVKTFIVGYNPPEELRVLADDTLRVVGYVPDLAPHFASRRLSVAPLRFGAGIKLKIINSLSYGMPVVATTVAAEGMPLTHGLDVFIADDPAAFARGVCDLYRDAALWERLSAGGLEVVRRHYSSDALRAQMAKLFDSL